MKAYLVLLGLVSVTIFADYLLKLASERPDWRLTWQFAAGGALYACSAVGWVLAMKAMPLASIGVAYSVMTMLLLAGLGVLVFRETLSARDLLGLGLAIAALSLMEKP